MILRKSYWRFGTFITAKNNITLSVIRMQFLIPVE